MAEGREKLRAWLYLGLVVAVVLGIVAALFLMPYLHDRSQENRIKALPLGNIGASEAAAGCQPRILKEVTLGRDRHVDVGTSLTYPDAPPAFGIHWAVPLAENEYEVLFTDDRPAKEQLVHSLEHGYTVIWYDEDLARDPEQMKVLETVMSNFKVKDAVIAAPWTAADGGAFPEGTRLAMTHWSVEDGENGIWQYCAGVSGSAIQSFIIDYPHKDGPEGGFS